MKAKCSTILFSYMLITILLSSSIQTETNAKSKPVEQVLSFEVEMEQNISKQNNIEVKELKREFVNIDIPTYTFSKPYEDGKLITDKTSLAYKWLSECEVDSRGHYMYQNKYYAVAMGTYFDEVGSRYRITLDTGKEFYVIKCDTKQDRHTTNRMIDHTGGMIEFIIDTDTASSYYGVGKNGYVLNGNFNNCDDFNGKIVKIEQIL